MGVHVPIASEALGAALCTSQIMKFFILYLLCSNIHGLIVNGSTPDLTVGRSHSGF